MKLLTPAEEEELQRIVDRPHRADPIFGVARLAALLLEIDHRLEEM